MQLKKFQKKRQNETPSPSLVGCKEISTKEELQYANKESEDPLLHIQKAGI